MKNMINWFEIPVTDFGRAKAFYESILNQPLDEQTMGPVRMGIFPMDEGKVSGAIVKGEGYVPSMAGALLYLNGNPDLAAVLGRVEKSGGSILFPKTAITPEYGFFALIKDTEGNRIALHSQH